MLRLALSMAAVLVATTPAFADEPVPAPAPTPPVPDPPGPTGALPAPTGAQPVPTDQPAQPPEVDPAYGERPEPVEGNTYFRSPTGKQIVIRMHPDRSKSNIIALAVAGGAGAIIGGVGVYFHLDSRAAADDVGADKFTGTAWTAERQEVYDRAYRSSVVAGVLYGIGGALLLGTAIGYMVTEPEMETLVIQPHAKGASVGTSWRF